MDASFLRKLAIISFFVWGAIVGNCYAQGENNIWYFGWNAGLDFNSGSPVVLMDGQTHVYEGCSTISDSTGNLLFYTDGVTVWNKNHQIMENGTGLMGDYSSSQSALIAKKPGSDSIYYIFTAGLEWGINEKLYYNIIDINANNSLGKVISKNIFLYEPISEHLAGTPHVNGEDIWILTHETLSNNFCAFLLTSSGLTTTPVISSTGCYLSKYCEGCIKVSRSGEYLAFANTWEGSFEVFDFSNETGILSNPISFVGYQTAYGSEFSPDESKLYFGARDHIYQIDLNAGSPSEILNSILIVGTRTPSSAGTLQLGPDMKIYFAWWGSRLGVINKPDSAGTNCELDWLGIYLNGSYGWGGLQNFVQPVYSYCDISYNYTCFEDTTMFWLTSNYSIDSVLWDFGDTASGANNTSTLPNPEHLYTSPGLFTVTATVFSGTTSRVYSRILNISAGPESGIFIAGTDSICQGQSQILFAIASIDDADSISWSLIPDSAGTIIGGDTIVYVNFASSFYGQAILSVSGINDCGTGDSAIYIIDVIGNPVAEAGPSAIICQNTNHTLGGSALNHSTAIWTTTGDGSFDDPFLVNATYTPGPIDIENGDVYLILHAFAINPCIYADADTMLLTLKRLANKPQTPIGPINIIIEPGLTSEYYTNSVGYADEYLWHLNPIESGIITGSDTTATVYWNDVYSGTLAFINVDAINDCGVVSSDTLTINLSPVAMEEVSLHSDQISIRPNPSDGIFNIDIISKVDEIDLRVINSTGINVKQYKINLKGDDNTFKIDLRDHLSGIYYLHFSFHGNSLVKKVLVNHNH